MSPSLLCLLALVLSPVTPLGSDPFRCLGNNEAGCEAASGTSTREVEGFDDGSYEDDPHALLPVEPNYGGKWQKTLFENDEETSEVLVLNSVSPLGSNSTSCDESLISQEERVIAEKGFYLDPLPLQTPGERELDLLLFGSM